MNPIKISRDLQNTLVDYLVATFDVNRDGQEPELAAALRHSFETRGALFKGPLLELNIPYMAGQSLEELCEAGILSPHLLDLPSLQDGRPVYPDMPLYAHQVQAIQKLCQQERNVVISSGTGSGKTESFLIPILNDLLLDPSPGVRALLIYPMNALVNDQLERLRVLLKGTNITFGRYTSELEDTVEKAREKLPEAPLENEVIAREEIRTRRKLPQILITNYAMLEYLLLRPEDSPLFDSGKWRFVVLDEAHTYAGAQGGEISLLLRRLKQRLDIPPGALRCIATSATLTRDDAGKAAEFAQHLFSETFTTEDVIFGLVDETYAESDHFYKVDPENYLPAENSQRPLDQVLADIRSGKVDLEETALYLEEIDLIPKEVMAYAEEEQDLGRFLWHILKGNEDLVALRQWMTEQAGAVPVEKAADYLFGQSLSPLEARLQALYNLIELGALARLDADKPPLLPARYHFFARSPQGIWACVNPACSGRQSEPQAGWSRLFSLRRETCDCCEGRVYPITVCRTCGQVYLRMYEEERVLLHAEYDPLRERKPTYFTWAEVHENRALVDEDDEQELYAPDREDRYQVEVEICLKCGRYGTRCICEGQGFPVMLYQLRQKNKDKKSAVQEVNLDFLNVCYRCQDKSQPDTEIVTEISIGNNNPITVLIKELYRHLPEAAHLPGKGRKLLTFSDTRQGAARFAAHLQDVVVKQHYRQVIYSALTQYEGEREHRPDLTDLSKFTTEQAWGLDIFHNDEFLPDKENLLRGSRPSSAQLGRLRSRIEAEMLAEFTVRRTMRQSLEGLGLIAVDYFEPNNTPDFASLGAKLRLSGGQAHSLIYYLLDDLRKSKLISLPQEIRPDDEVFGRNIAYSALVLRNPQGGEQPWIGATPRHSRRVLVQWMLSHVWRSPASDKDVETALIEIWDWLLALPYSLFVGEGAKGYRLNHNHLFFYTDAAWYRCNSCQRLYARGNALPCPHRGCKGSLNPVALSQQRGYYYHMFTAPLLPMRVEEHTAQLDSQKGREYQEWFKRGRINVLSCSTTFEMGIDLGDLQAVVMNNVPPTVANYRQRAGRAGRRTSGTAFILTWAQGDRPHDQTYFNQPTRIISGEVRVPHLALDNPFIQRRHINAILFSDFLRWRNAGGRADLGRVGDFFDPQTAGGCHFDALTRWRENHEERLLLKLENFVLPLPSDGQPTIPQQRLSDFMEDMQRVQEAYSAASGYYTRQISDLTAQILKNPGKAGEITDDVKRFGGLLERLNEESLISHLSNKGVLPSYSFPLYTVELTLPYKERNTAHLRLQRDLKQAIREYAPGGEVVADKRLWRSAGLEFLRKAPKIFHYHICTNCHFLQIGRAAGMEITQQQCPLCGEKIKPHKKFLTPDGFWADWQSGKAAGQFVKSAPSLMQSGLVADTLPQEETLSSLVRVIYQRQGTLLYVNEGLNGKGFKICMDCGKVAKRKETKCANKLFGKPCPGSRFEEVTLGHQIQTDTLHLRFGTLPHVGRKDPGDTPFWVSLTTALLQGAARALQIERRDLDGVLFPYRPGGAEGWEQTVVLFDNVAGGAGHVRHILDEFPRVIEEALRVVNCVECAPETSCDHCLRDYNNQLYHNILRRDGVIQFLEAIQASLDSQPGDVAGAGRVVAVDVPRWLIQQCRQARDHLVIAAHSLKRGAPQGESLNWLETFQEMLQRGVQIDLSLHQLPAPSPDDAEALSIAEYLHFLQKRYPKFSLFQADGLPEWQILIDPYDRINARAIKTLDGLLQLDAHAGEQGLITTLHPDGVEAAIASMQMVNSQPVGELALKPPQDVRVWNLKFGDKHTEESLFGELFARPVTKLEVNDRYLIDEERIVNRLGAYIRMAYEGGALQEVVFRTNEAGRGGTGGTHEGQQRAIDKLLRMYDGKGIRITAIRNRAEHDRSVLLIRPDGSKSRILIGRGLDFIQPDGRIEPTYIVIQDPYYEAKR